MNKQFMFSWAPPCDLKIQHRQQQACCTAIREHLLHRPNKGAALLACKPWSERKKRDAAARRRVKHSCLPG